MSAHHIPIVANGGGALQRQDIVDIARGNLVRTQRRWRHGEILGDDDSDKDGDDNVPNVAAKRPRPLSDADKSKNTTSHQALTLQRIFEQCEESNEGWKMEGRRWVSLRNNTSPNVTSELRGEVCEKGLGPPKIMLVELIHAHHNNVGSHDLTYDSMEQFFGLNS